MYKDCFVYFYISVSVLGFLLMSYAKYGCSQSPLTQEKKEQYCHLMVMSKISITFQKVVLLTNSESESLVQNHTMHLNL